MRLAMVVIFSGRFEEMRAFYQRRVGLEAPPSKDGWQEFETAGARLGLHGMDDPERHGMVLRFEVPDLDARVAALRKRGVKLLGPPADYPWGRFAEFQDAEGNPVGLYQPKTPARPVRDGAPDMDRVVVSCRDFQQALHFYHEQLGLKATVATDHWAEFDTGATRLALHPRRRDVDHPPHSDQAITVVLGSNDLLAWVEEMRARDLHFATAPIDEDFGLYAEAADPDGYMVVFREPPPPATIEDELIEAYADDEESPHQVAIRKPAQKPSRAGVVIAGLKKRERREAAQARAERAEQREEDHEAKKLDIVSPRGSGEAGSREKPKREHDPKRARAKPAIGSLRESERQSIAAKKRSVAKKSKTKPVKSAAKRPRAAAPKKAAAKKKGGGTR